MSCRNAMATRSLKERLFGRLSARRVMLSLIEIYVGVTIGVWLLADKIIHHPPSRRYGPLPGEVRLQTSDGLKLCAVWMPNPKATHTLLFSHGNAEDLGHDLPFLRELGGAGFNVFGYDYRGYGRSEGKPNEKGLYRDIDAAYKHLVEKLKVRPEQIIVLGRSLGSGPSTWLASRQPVGGVVFESAFTSAFRVVIPFPLFPFDQFPNLKWLPQVRCPILVIHGTSDTIISMKHGKRLYEAYQGPKESWWVEGADHNDLFDVAGDAYLKRLQDFSKRVGIGH